MENTKISWARHTFNPWEGCTKVGPGCDHCYAAARDERFHGGQHWGPGAPRRRTSVMNWGLPIRWNERAAAAGERHRVFCASLADVFDNEADPAWRADLWRLVDRTAYLDWIILTKRIGNVANMLPPDWGAGYHNVWLVATVVDQAEADRDIPKLLAVPAAVRGLSMEPLLERVRIQSWLAFKPRIDWVIAGAESGPDRRPMEDDWARFLLLQCNAYGTAFFYKQQIVGGKKIETPELDGRTWTQFPKEERCQN